MAERSSKTASRKAKTARAESEALSGLIAKSKSEDPRAEERSNPTDLAEESRRGLQSFVEANAAILNGMAALSAEMVAFGNKRLSANVENTQTVASCRDVEQAFRVQSEFFESAVQQYLDQAKKILEIMASMSTGVWSPLKEQATETLHDLDTESDPSKGR